MEQITSEYKDVFEGLGQLGPKLHLEVDETVKPVQQAVRKIPESMKDPLKYHLAELEENGIIEKVYQPTEWISSIVVAKKSNGGIRLCLDPRPLNKALKRCHHPMQTIEDILPELGKAKIFSKLDCLNGYWQVPLDEESSFLTTFGTPFGRYRWKRLPFGISPAGEIFQRRLDQAIEGLQGVKTVADDILVIGNGDSVEEATNDHDAKLKQLLERCRERGVKPNETKILLKQTSTPYIGHVLTSAGVKADPAKIEAIVKMERPTSVDGVRRIMGTINYLAKFLPLLSDVSEPIRQLTKKDVAFVWDQVHDQAFSKLKELVTQPPLLKYYEPEKELVIQCDASEGGLGAALLQEGRPIAYASRALTATERNYAQIEKELLAIVLGAERFHQYTYGRPVSVDSDHKPLEVIFAKPLASAPRRLQRMLMRLQMYDLCVRYKKGTELHLADTLSRHYLKTTEEIREGEEALNFLFEREREEHEEMMEINQLLSSEDTINMYRSKTDEDESLRALKKVVLSGWPEAKNDLPALVESYFHFRDELVVQDGLILRGDRLVIPKTLRKPLMENLHASHQGIEATLRRAGESMYWTNMNAEIKDYAKKRELCCRIGLKQSKKTLVSHVVHH